MLGSTSFNLCPLYTLRLDNCLSWSLTWMQYPLAFAGMNVLGAGLKIWGACSDYDFLYPDLPDVPTMTIFSQGRMFYHDLQLLVVPRRGCLCSDYRDFVHWFDYAIGLRTWEKADDPWSSLRIGISSKSTAKASTIRYTEISLDIFRAVYPGHRDLQSRLESYQGWGWSHMQNPHLLATTGFCYAGYRNCVRCFYCGVGLRTWDKQDYPWVKHVRWRVSSDCVRCIKEDQLVMCNRVYGLLQEYPLSAKDVDSTTAKSLSLSLANHTMSNKQPSTRTSTPALKPAPASTSIITSDSASISARPSPGLDMSRAVHPQFSDVQIRLHSYQGWGWSHVQNPQVPAIAGFYHAGYKDCVRCFYCGVGLRTWEKQDDPWVEHVRWRSSCDYVRCMKGEHFVTGTHKGDSQRHTNLAAAASTPINDAIQSGRVTQCINVPEKTTQMNRDSRYAFKKLDTALCNVDMIPCHKYETEKEPGKAYDFMDKGYNLSSIQPTQFLVACPFTSLRTYFSEFAARRRPNIREHYEGFRLQSYSSVRVDTSAIRLAAAGFYATGDEDETKCYSCGGTKRNWRAGDNPFEVHRSMSPHCTHVRGRDRRNVPIHPTATCTLIQEEHDVYVFNEGTNRQLGLPIASSFDHRHDYSLGDSTTRASTEQQSGPSQNNFVNNNNSSLPLASNMFMTAQVVNEEQDRENQEERGDRVEVFEEDNLEVTLGNFARLNQVSEEGDDGY